MRELPEDQPVSEQDYQIGEVVQHEIELVIQLMKAQKPNDRSEQDRKIAIAITDAEKLLAWWMYVTSETQP